METKNTVCIGVTIHTQHETTMKKPRCIKIFADMCWKDGMALPKCHSL